MSGINKATPSSNLVSDPLPASFFEKLKFGHYQCICTHSSRVGVVVVPCGLLCTIVSIHNGNYDKTHPPAS